MFKHESFIQYSFLKNLFLSFFIVNFYFVVKLFFKADRRILKQHPFF
ncbi:membrane protein [Helicobacter pylori]|nr:membrane protein [Helicobacter pylori]